VLQAFVNRNSTLKLSISLVLGYSLGTILEVVVASILFDCDSTLLRIESLEYLLEDLLDEDEMEQVADITAQGMRGDIPFHVSLERRLEMADLDHSGIAAFNELIDTYLSEDSEDLIVDLLANGHQVYLVSGGLKEVIEALARHLGLSESRVYAVNLLWNEHGQFQAVNPDDPMTQSKEIGLQKDIDTFERPIIAIGDGMTDARLKDAGIADVFIAYTEHERRESVVEKADYEVEDMQELSDLLEELLC